MLRPIVGALALGLLVGCDDDKSVAIHVCSNAIIPPEGISLVVVDGSFVDERDLLPMLDGGEEFLEPDAGMPQDLVDPDALVEIDAVRVSTRDADFEELKVGVHELSSGNDLKKRGFDLMLELPLGSNAQWLNVDALRESVVVSTFTRRIVDRDDLETVEMPLSGRCYGELCAFGLTCLGGSCELAPDTNQGPRCTKAALE